MASRLSSFLGSLSCCTGGEDGSSDEKQMLLTPAPAIKPSIRLSGPVFSTNPMVYPRPSDPLLIDVPPAMSKAESVERIVQAMVRCSTPNDVRSLPRSIEREVRICGGWNEWLAENVVNKLKEQIDNGNMDSWGEAFRKAYAKVKEVLDEMIEWAEDHPYVATAIAFVVVFGILMLICPWVLEVLGFGEAGPAADSFAAAWQATYGGYVRRGSIFSVLQRLGMTRKRWGWV